MAARLRALTVKGFRAYGAGAQTLSLPAEIATVWGPNSKGKTSLAETFEFLFTGRIARRELMASSQDEFADALRNAHLDDVQEVSVAVRLAAPDGTEHEIKRTLASDYAKRQDCASRLEIDGVKANESDLAALGITLSQPPLQAPVLAQHTLSYIFSVRPQDRATYFKTLLEVTDLDELRNDIAASADGLKPPDDPLIAKFDRCADLPVLKPALSGQKMTISDLATFTTRLSDAAQALIENTGGDVPGSLEDRLAAIAKTLADRRGRTFPVRGFERKPLAGWNTPADEIWDRLTGYLDECKKVDEQTRQLTALFEEALKLPAITDLDTPVDCPLCGTESALTPERVQLIRQHVADTSEFKQAEKAAQAALSRLTSSADSLANAFESAMPQYIRMTAAQRRSEGFTVARIRALLGDRAAEFVDPWLDQLRPLIRAGAARRDALTAIAVIKEQTDDMADALDPQHLQDCFDNIAARHKAFAAATEAYDPPAQALITVLNEVIDAQEDTAGWQDFLDIAAEPVRARSALIDRQAHAAIMEELGTGLKQIDRAKEQVLDDKFSEYSSLIEQWWERLRPDEATFFSAVQPRKGAKRTIDFKAGLSADPDRSTAKVRDAIAVFSQSQLHCLGLALFLARAEHERLGFIILDDPVLSSDEDYRVHFNSTVLSALLDLPMQVVVLTQDHDTWEELETRYRHRGISTAQLFIETPAEGSIIENTSDALLAKITRARSLARGGHPDSRKECGIQLRDAGERFCKEMLVKDRRAKGEAAASLTDYDGKILEWLCPRVDPLLDHDASHPGKLQAFKNTVNDACHDNAPPSNAAMIQACGEIAYFQKDYLAR